MARFRSPRWLTALALCAVLPALVFSADVPGPPVRLLRALLDAGTANRVVVNDGSGLLSDAAAITPSRVLLSNGSGIPVANGALSTNRVNYWDGSGLVSAAALTSGRVLLADANGLPTSNAALTTNRLIYGNATGLVSNAALTASTLLLADANGLPVSRAALTVNRLVLSGSDGLLDVNAALTANRVLLSDASGFPVASTVTNTTLGYLDATSSIQTQIDGLAAASGFKLLTTLSPSGAATVDINSTYITSTYDKYLIEFDLTPATDDVFMQVRTDTANGASIDNGAADYQWFRYQMLVTGAAIAESTADTSMIVTATTASRKIGNDVMEGIVGRIYLERKGAASGSGRDATISWHAYWMDNGTRPNMVDGFGARVSQTTINFLSLSMNSGNLTGKVRVYGLVN